LVVSSSSSSSFPLSRSSPLQYSLAPLCYCLDLYLSTTTWAGSFLGVVLNGPRGRCHPGRENCSARHLLGRRSRLCRRRCHRWRRGCCCWVQPVSVLVPSRPLDLFLQGQLGRRHDTCILQYQHYHVQAILAMIGAKGTNRRSLEMLSVVRIADSGDAVSHVLFNRDCTV
jgi:hypothetical protein